MLLVSNLDFLQTSSTTYIKKWYLWTTVIGQTSTKIEEAQSNIGVEIDKKKPCVSLPPKKSQLSENCDRISQLIMNLNKKTRDIFEKSLRIVKGECHHTSCWLFILKEILVNSGTTQAMEASSVRDWEVAKMKSTFPKVWNFRLNLTPPSEQHSKL